LEARYEIDIFWSIEDEAYVAVVPALPNCSARGASREEALARAQEAIREEVKVRQKYGAALSEPSLTPSPATQPHS
jgi:predicted RNase H-like HicB family nuclease